MSDHVSVVLTVLKSHARAVESAIADNPDTHNMVDTTPAIDSDGTTELMLYHFADVNYGVLEFEQFLDNHRIPYTKSVEAGMESGARLDHIRYRGSSRQEVQTGPAGANISLPALVNAHNAGRLDEFLAECVERYTPLPWASQLSSTLRHEQNTKATFAP